MRESDIASDDVFDRRRWPIDTHATAPSVRWREGRGLTLQANRTVELAGGLAAQIADSHCRGRRCMRGGAL
jgi:hypothetical protein